MQYICVTKIRVQQLQDHVYLLRLSPQPGDSSLHVVSIT